MLHRHGGHAEAVARIRWWVAETALGVITGEVGAGKTVALRAALAELDPSPPGPTGPPPCGAGQRRAVGILPITWAYGRLIGAAGLTQATKVAVLAANYVARRLLPYYSTLYSRASRLVAHECILDLRPLTRATGVTVDEVAKRLIDYGFHTPTMSFPVAGTLMVEPTESEDLREVDRFMDAMISIRAEIEQIATGEHTASSSPLLSVASVEGDGGRSRLRGWGRLRRVVVGLVGGVRVRTEAG
jgi:glycine cleavage system P protein (glycine dehydrogenase)